jgi:pimeloyl-ACP methyl ester carboxylesterase
MKRLLLTAPLLTLLACGGPHIYNAAEDCGDTPFGDEPSLTDGDNPAPDVIAYRELAGHPGCSTEGLSYPAASIPGYQCAAKDYTGTEDPSKPIVLLIHGNSDRPHGWEANVDTTCDDPGSTQGVDMLAERLRDAGYRTYAIDMRPDLGDDPDGNNDDENAAKNMDHGWGVPLAQHFIRSVADAYPDRRISLAGFSFGVTVIRDALRRMDVVDGAPLWHRIEDLMLLAGGNHGVSTFRLCGANPTMRGQVTCEMGDRAAFSPTPFLTTLNGADGSFETPCGDGGLAFGRDVCEGNTIDYTTIVMQDIPGGTQQDLFVSEASAALSGADNVTIGLNDFDESDYFFCGLFKNHYGAARSLVALDHIMTRFAD